ncbi:protein phosphatase regulator [Recurvomyces mirabilis]|nr:protein phosphatase regulator [Recurvomyces mirabilis]
MAEVLHQIPRSPSGEQLYENTGGLRRSHASTGQLYQGSSFLSSSPKDDLYVATTNHHDRISDSPRSSFSDTFSTNTSTSDLGALDTPNTIPEISGLSLEEKFGSNDDGGFPDYGGMQFYHQAQGYAESQSSEEPVESTTTETTASDSPLPTPTVADDSAIRKEPKQHVDYLSHNWREEDIWSSWRHIVSQRKVYGQRSRLENASWRTWAQSKYALRTVSPETLNWLKESDVTWLYGPLKPAESHPITSHQSAPSSQLSKTNSFLAKKPILKKRSMSEVMLQRSISATSLVKQAAASVQAQQGSPRKPTINGAHFDITLSGFTSEAPSRDQVDYFTSRHSSDDGTPCECSAKRHIRFDDKVEQCIAVEHKEDLAEESESEEDEVQHSGSSDASSDDGVIMMKRKRRSRANKDAKGSRSNSQSRKMIETLPASTLKYKTEAPDVAEAPQHHTFGSSWRSSRLSPSPSQETLRPSRPSANFLVKDEEEPEEAMSSTWSFGASNPKSSLGSASSSEDEMAGRSRRKNKMTATKARSSTPGPSDDYSAELLRRTNSGMLMPYDDEEDDAMAVGLFGKVSETINTARDIAHVIWNVGWRK